MAPAKSVRTIFILYVACFSRNASVLGLRTRRFHRLTPLVDFALEECGELFGRIPDEFGALGRDAFGAFGQLGDTNDFVMKLGNDVPRCSGRHGHTKPRTGVESFEPLLAYRRHVMHYGNSFERSHA